MNTVKHVTVRIKNQSYVVEASKVVGLVWTSVVGSVVVDSVLPAASKTVFLPSEARITRINEPSCDASFNEMTGQMEFSAR